MKKLIKPLLSILLVILVGISILWLMPVSCEKQEVDEIGPRDDTSETAVQGDEPVQGEEGTVDGEIHATAGSIIFYETAEGSSPYSTARSTDLCCSHSRTEVTNPVFDGTKSSRFELRETDPLESDGKRAEITIVKGAEGDITKNTWYSYAVYFPSVGFERDSEAEIISQWYQANSPATAFRIKDDRFMMHTGNSLEPDNRQQLDLGPVTKDTWHQFVFHFIHSYGSDGLIEVWHNGNKVLNHPGGNMYNTTLPKWKIGVYKSAFKYGTSSVDKRVLYFDNVKVGGPTATLAEMMPKSTSTTTTTPPPTTTTTTPPPTTTTTTPPPTTTTTTPPPTTTTITGAQQVVSFTLVNAETDRDIMTITNGGSISLNSIGTSKVNIRANTSPGTVGSVVFNLTGAYNRNSTDSVVPYALQGDDGTGNYYSWAPKTGNYTLVAKPYTERYGKGTAGTALTIKFSITR